MAGLLQVGRIRRNALRINLKQEKEKIAFQKNLGGTMPEAFSDVRIVGLWVTSCPILDEF